MRYSAMWLVNPPRNSSGHPTCPTSSRYSFFRVTEFVSPAAPSRRASATAHAAATTVLPTTSIRQLARAAKSPARATTSAPRATGTSSHQSGRQSSDASRGGNGIRRCAPEYTRSTRTTRAPTMTATQSTSAHQPPRRTVVGVDVGARSTSGARRSDGDLHDTDTEPPVDPVDPLDAAPRHPRRRRTPYKPRWAM